MSAVLLPPSEVTARIGFAEQTLANWRSKRTGPPWVKVGRLVRYPEDRLDAWIAENAVART